MVRDAANAILAQNYTPLYDEEPPTVGLHWPARYLKQSIYNYTKAKPIKTARKKAQDPGYIHNWFEGLRAYYTENNINPDDFWNFDESGVRLGVARNQLV